MNEENWNSLLGWVEEEKDHEESDPTRSQILENCTECSKTLEVGEVPWGTDFEGGEECLFCSEECVMRYEGRILDRELEGSPYDAAIRSGMYDP